MPWHRQTGASCLSNHEAEEASASYLVDISWCVFCTVVAVDRTEKRTEDKVKKTKLMYPTHNVYTL